MHDLNIKLIYIHSVAYYWITLSIFSTLPLKSINLSQLVSVNDWKIKKVKFPPLQSLTKPTYRFKNQTFVMSQRARPGVGSAQFLLPPVSVTQTITWFDPHAEFILGPCNLRLGLSCKLWSPVWEEIIIQPTAEDTGIRSSRQYLRSSSHGIVAVAPVTGLCRLGINFQTLLHKKHLSKATITSIHLVEMLKDD